MVRGFGRPSRRSNLSFDASHLPRCDCGRWVSMRRSYGWFKYGEHGTEEGWVCARCVTDWTPQDSLGRGPSAGYCGIVLK